MTLWPWLTLQVGTQEGLKRADPAALGPFSAWLHERIRRRRTYNDDVDLAQAICDDLRRMMRSPDGRRTLRSVKNLPALLEQIALRLRDHERRARRRYDAAVREFVGVAHVADPSEHLQYVELKDAIDREILKLDSLTQRILGLHLEGFSRREIAALIWPKKPRAAAEKRVKDVLEAARAKLRVALARRGDGPESPRSPKKWRS